MMVVVRSGLIVVMFIATQASSLVPGTFSPLPWGF